MIESANRKNPGLSVRNSKGQVFVFSYHHDAGAFPSRLPPTAGSGGLPRWPREGESRAGFLGLGLGLDGADVLGHDLPAEADGSVLGLPPGGLDAAEHLHAVAGPQVDRFGKVVEGIEVVDQIASVKTDYNDRPYEDQQIEFMTVQL